MGDDFESFRCRGGFSSPPCYAAEIAPDYFDPLAVDSQQAHDVARWRRAERTRLREMRKAQNATERKGIAEALISGVREALLKQPVRIVSFYWPIHDEPDLRPLMEELCTRGVDIALPLVETKSAPLVFRRWTPKTRLVRGIWNILVPPPDVPLITPDALIAPLVGWDSDGYRLGYGGGYFDRSLAALPNHPFAIGVGVQAAQLATIFPQPHDIAFDLILTEHGPQVEKPRENP